MKIITESEFRIRLINKLSELQIKPNCVTGPGRSGAIASVYASHLLRIPFIPYGTKIPEKLKPALVIDTAIKTGYTLRKAARKAEATLMLALFEEPPLVQFWYESV